MKQQLVLRSQAPEAGALPPVVETLRLGPRELSFCWVPARTGEKPGADEVIVETTHFTVNYRDRAITFGKGVQLDSSPFAGWAAIGSEFCGVVVSAGSEVDGALVGQRVIGRNDFDPDGAPPQGISTNNASRRFLRLKASRVVQPPQSLSDAEACTFGLAAQTAASMVRRGKVGKGNRVLVTGGNSHTSRFLAQLACYAGAEVVVATRDAASWTAPTMAVRWVTIEELAQTTPAPETRFHAILDPFIDVYAPVAMRLLRSDGIYVTCGFANQVPDENAVSPLSDVIIPAMVRCAHIEVNAIGTADDLDHATRVAAAGGLVTPPTAVFSPAEAPAFLRAAFGVDPSPGRPVMAYVAEQGNDHDAVGAA